MTDDPAAEIEYTPPGQPAEASTRHIAGAARDVVWSELRDAGDMFKSEVGVWRDPDGRFRAYVKGGWGCGVQSKPHPDQQAARADIGRLWEKFYG